MDEFKRWFETHMPVGTFELDQYLRDHNLKLSKADKDLLFIRQWESLRARQLVTSIDAPEYQESEAPSVPAEHLHKAYRFDQQLVLNIFKIIRGETRKINTVCFVGPSNCGKTLLVSALCKPWLTGFIARDSGVNIHWLENLLYKTIVRWEEPIVTSEIKEDLKLLLGGEEVCINAKGKPLVVWPYRTPLLMSTNNYWWHYYNDPAYINRMFIVHFDTCIDDVTELKNAYINRAAIINYLRQVAHGQFDR